MKLFILDLMGIVRLKNARFKDPSLQYQQKRLNIFVSGKTFYNLTLLSSWLLTTYILDTWPFSR